MKANVVRGAAVVVLTLVALVWLERKEIAILLHGAKEIVPAVSKENVMSHNEAVGFAHGNDALPPPPSAEPANLAIVPGDLLDFGRMRLTGTEGIVTLVNRGGAAAPVTSATINGDVLVSKSNCQKEVPAGESCTITVVARPKSAGPISGQLAIVSGATAVTLRFSGQALADEETSEARRLREQASPQVQEIVTARQNSGPAILTDEDAVVELAAEQGRDPDYRRLGIQKERTSLPVDRCWVITQDRYITAVLETPIVDFIAGEVRAVQDRPVYGASCRRKLLPTGTRWIGHYNKGTTMGVSRVDIVWERVILPNGASAVFNWGSADMMGRAGVPGDRDLQLVERYGAFLLETGFNLGLAGTLGSSASGTSQTSALGTTTTSGGNQAMLQALQQGGQNFQNTTQGIFDQAFPVRSAVSVPKGTPMIIYPGTDLWLRQAEDDEEAEIVPVDPLAAKRVADSRQRAQERTDKAKKSEDLDLARLARIGAGAATGGQTARPVAQPVGLPVIPASSTQNGAAYYSGPTYNQVETPPAATGQQETPPEQ